MIWEAAKRIDFFPTAKGKALRSRGRGGVKALMALPLKKNGLEKTICAPAAML